VAASAGEYQVVVQKVPNPFARNVNQAAKALSQQVNSLIALGWQPVGGVAIGNTGTVPYLLQALVKPR
jgi:hypothetical protein